MKSLLNVRSLAAALAFVAAAQTASAQRVVVSHDEWFTGSAFGTFNANEQRLVSNALGFFGVGSGGSVLINSTNGFLADAGFVSYLQGLGITVTVDGSTGSFAGYGAVFAGGNPSHNAAGLVSYVQGGGNAFYIGGTGTGGPGGEADYSNPFLNAFGFDFARVYNNIGTTNTSAFAAQGPYGASLFTGVSSVYANNGNSISLTAPVSFVTSQLFSDANGAGVFGAAEYSAQSSVPEPASVALMTMGLLALLPLARRRQKN